MTAATVIEALALGLYDRDCHDWASGGDWDSLRPTYEEQARRFLLPRLVLAGVSA